MPKEVAMSPERHVKIFKNGRNEAVRIPREFEFSGEDAIMRKEGDQPIIEPAPQLSQLAWSATMWHSRSGTVLNPPSSCD
jgi:antitoxin VapB